MSNNKVYVIVSIKTGKIVTDGARLPFFWYKYLAAQRRKDILDSEVKSVELNRLNEFLGAGWKPVPSKKVTNEQ